MSLAADSYLLGAVFLIVVLGAAALVAEMLMSRRLGHLAGSERALAWVLLWTTSFLLANLLPLTLGLLSRPAVLICAGLLLLGVWRLPAKPGGAAFPLPEPLGDDGPLSRAIAALALLAVTLFTLQFLRRNGGVPVDRTDALAFQLPGVGRWIQDGSLWSNIEFLPNLPVGNYPNNGDLMFLGAILPWRNDALVRFVDLPFLAMTALAVYVAARELRAGKTASILLAAAVLAIPSVSVSALDAVKPDTFMLATFGAGVAFLLRHRRTDALSDLVLAGLGIGLALGSRWYGLSAAVVVIGVWLLAQLWARRGPRDLAPRLGVLAGLALAGGAVWFARNWITTGNPLFPVQVGALGVTVFDAPTTYLLEEQGWNIAHYLADGRVVRESILPDYRDALGFTGLVLVAGTLAATIGALARRGRDADAPAVLVVAAATAGIVLAYLITPGGAAGPDGHPAPGIVGANVRWVMPAGMLAAVLVAVSITRIRGWTRIVLELAVLAATVDGVARSFGASRPKVLAVTLLVLGGVALAAKLADPWRAGLRSAVSARATVLAGTATLAVAVALGYVNQQNYNEYRYAKLDPTFAWLQDHAAPGSRVGLATGGSVGAGTVPVWPLFGARIRNSVEFVGPFRRGMLRTYQNESEVFARLASERYDYVLVRAWRPDARPSREARAALEAGMVPVARGRYVLFRSEDS